MSLNDRIQNMLNLWEYLIRVHDQLDEQLHAGFFFYVLTSPTRFFDNSQYCYPMAMIVLGFLIPEILNYLDFLKEHGNTENDFSLGYAILFICGAYISSFIMTFMPELYYFL